MVYDWHFKRYHDHPTYSEVTLSFASDSIRVSEGYYSLLCINITGPSCPALLSFDITLTVSGTGKQLFIVDFITFYVNTAKEGVDYGSIDRTVAVPQCQHQQCVPVNITDDDIVENSETITFTMSTRAARVRVDLSKNFAIITIDNNDSE